MPSRIQRLLQRALMEVLPKPAAPKPRAPEDCTGDYASWQEASSLCNGYGSQLIFEKTRDAALAVRDGRAAYERDSVLFQEPSFNWPLLAALLRQAARDSGRLSVLDFGGSLGSQYFQSRDYLRTVADLSWSVVEQAHYVEFGKAEMTVGALRFFESVEACLQATSPNVLLLSSVLQYLPAPRAFLASLASRGIPSVIIDRAPFIDAERDRLTIQHVPEHIYTAEYPAWFFCYSGLRQLLSSHSYEHIAEWDSIDHLPLDGKPLQQKGCLFVAKTTAGSAG